MKQLVANYSFNVEAKTLTLSDFAAVHAERLLLVEDQTAGVQVYSVAPGSGVTVSAASNVLTFSAVPQAAANGDELSVFYDCLAGDPLYDAYELLSTAANQSTEIARLTAIESALTGTLTVTDSATESAVAALASLIAGGQLDVADVAAEGSLSTLAGTVSGGKVAVALSAEGITIGEVELTDGTNTANVLAQGTPNSTGNALLTAATSQPVAFSTTTAQAVATVDAGNYSCVSVAVSSQGTNSSVTFQCSNDNANWFSLSLVSSASVTGQPATNIGGATGLWSGPLAGRYFRVNVSGITAGTTAGSVVLSTGPKPPVSVGVNGNVTSTFVNTADAGTITSASSTVVSSTTRSGYGGTTSISVHGTYAGVGFVVTVSDDGGTTYYNVPVYDATNAKWYVPGAAITPASNATNLYYTFLPPNTAAIKVTANAWTSGTCNVRFDYGASGSIPSQLVQDAATGTIGAAIPGSASLVAMQDSSGDIRTLKSATDVGDTATGDNLLATVPSLLNGASFDRQRNNTTAALVAAGTTTTQTVSFTTFNARGLAVVVDISSFTSGSLTLAINGVTASGYTYPLFSSISALTATGITVYRVGMGLTPAAGAYANDVLPRTVQIVATVSGTLTYGIDTELSV